MSGRRVSRLLLDDWRAPRWRSPALWQCAAFALALVPAAWALWLRLGPIPALPEPEPPPAQALPVLRPLARAATPDADPSPIAASNLFAASRADWPAAVVAADAPKPAPDELKQALDALDKFVVVAVIRSGSDLSALLDPGDRKPGDDLTTLRAGAEHKGWTVESVSRDGVEVRHGDTRRTLRIGPKSTPPQAAAALPSAGRRRFDVAEVGAGSRRLVIEPPISPAEARRQLLERVPPEDTRLRQMVDTLLERLDKERGPRPAPPPDPLPGVPRR